MVGIEDPGDYPFLRRCRQLTVRERHCLQIVSTKVNEGRKYFVAADESLDWVKLIRVVFFFFFSLSLLAGLQDPTQEAEMTTVAQSLLLDGPSCGVIVLAA